MRASFLFAAVAGVAVGFLGAPGANAMTNTSPVGVRVATEAMDTSALVHCRPYRHMHEWEHRRTFGCHGGGSVEIRRGHRERVGVEERESGRSSVHSRTTRGESSVRGSTKTKTGESTKSSTGPGKTGETKPGTSGGSTTGRGQGGEKPSTGGSSGGTSGAQPSGQKQ